MFLHPPHTATRLSGRQLGRLAAVAVSVGALLFAAACGGGGGSAPNQGASASADPFTQQGPIEYWAGKDVTGNLPKVIEEFNKQHPQGQVTLHELPDAADQQRQQMVQNTQIKNDKMAVLSVDNVWTAEFAANQWVIPLPEDKFPTSEFLKSPVNSATYFDKMYAYPYQTDGGLLYYRKDLLDKYDLKAPTTWAEMTAACKKIKAGENDSKLSCYAGQFQKYEGLTCNFAEAIDSAGGQITDENGKPNVNTPEALKGLSFLTDSFKDGTIPKAAITWQEEQSRTAFQNGELIFLRNWAYVYRLAQKTDGIIEGCRKIRGRSAAWPQRPRRVHPRRPQPGHRHLRRQQGHRSRLHQVHVLRGSRQVRYAGHRPSPCQPGLVLRSGHPEEVPALPDLAEVDRDRQSAPQGRQVRRRDAGHARRRVRRPAR